MEGKTWGQAARELQPQFSGLQRAANAGTGAGPRSYAPGMTTAYGGGGGRMTDAPLAREFQQYPSTPGPSGPPASGGQGAFPPAHASTPPQAFQAIAAQQAQYRAQQIVDGMIARARASKAARGNGY